MNTTYTLSTRSPRSLIRYIADGPDMPKIDLFDERIMATLGA